VKVTASETLINQKSNFVLEVDLPLPLNAGCKIDVLIPKPLVIGPEMTRVTISGLFGSIRDAEITLDAELNRIHVQNACLSYRANVVKAVFELSALVNPGYVTTSESFFLEVSDANDNKIVKTSGGMVYTTSPGSVKVNSWFASNRLVSALSDITFSVQPFNPSPAADVQIKLYLPREDFEEVPSPCKVVFTNQLVDASKISCASDPSANALILSHVLKDRYTFNELSSIEFSVSDVRMPSSTRPTGTYTVEFLANIGGVYKLVDTATVTDMLRALPGGLL